MKAQDLILDRYQLLHLYTEREHTQTWEALDQHTQSSVMLKTLHLEAIQDWQAYTLFEREAEALKSLQHPQIPRFIDFFKDAGYAMVVQEKIDGETLRSRMDRRWKVSEAQARELIAQALNILSAVHTATPPLIHRDIKPENMMLDAQDRVYLIDFGAVRQRNLSNHTVAGSFAYMAPEQLSGQALPSSDLYALGMTWIELLSGSPLEALPRQGLYIDFSDALQVSEGFKRWLQHMVAPYPTQRFSTAAEALASLSKTEHLPALQHRTSTRASHGKQELTPAIWLEETPTDLRIEIKGDQINGALLGQLGIYTIGCFALYVAIYVASAWIMHTYWPKLGIDTQFVAIVSSSLLSPFLCIALYHRWFGPLSGQHSLHIDDTHLTHTFVKKRGMRRAKKVTRVYTRAHLKKIRFSASQIHLHFSHLQRGFFVHRMSLLVPFPLKTRETLSAALQEKGIHSHV